MCLSINKTIVTCMLIESATQDVAENWTDTNN